MRKLTANLVKMASATSGAGTVTCTQIAGWMQFSDRFSTGDLVWYEIQDGSNREIGLGTYNGSNQLARTNVYETLVAGTVTVTPAGTGTPITLSGAGATVQAVISEELFDQFVRLQHYPGIVANQNIGDGGRYGIAANNLTLTISNWGSTSGPLLGDLFHIYQGAASITGTIINPNGALIEGVAGNMTIDIPNFGFHMLYTGATYGWVIF